MTKDIKEVNPDLHVSVGKELKAELMEFYPGHGDLSRLVKNLLMAVLALLQNDKSINPEQIARVTIDTERRRGLRGSQRTSEPETE